MRKFLKKILFGERRLSLIFLIPIALFVFSIFSYLKFPLKNFISLIDTQIQPIGINDDKNPIASSANLEWFQKPAAIRFVGKHDRTYITWIANSGKIQIRYYDNKNDTFSPTYTVDDLYSDYKVEAQDDHNAPSLLILPDGHILIFYAVHDGNNAFFMRESVNVEDISTWTVRNNISDSGTNLPYNYPQAKRLSNGNLLLFYRRGNYYDSDEYFKTSKDNGKTWENPTKLIDFGNDGVYALVFVKGDTIYITWNESLSTNPPRKNIYYMFSSDGGNTWQKTNRDKLSLPVTRGNAEVVFDSGDDADYVWDIVADSSNNPYIVFAYKEDPNHEFRFAQWNGAIWVTNTITTSTQLYGNNNFYSGGIVIDPKNVYSVYLSKKREHLEIERWVSYDKGKTWQEAEAITKDSGVDNFRMQLVENYSDSLRLIWASGTYEGSANGQWVGFSKVNIQSDRTKN